MTKYSYELKKEVVLAYLNGEGGYEYLTAHYGISTHTCIERWVANYKAFGDDGLRRSRQQQVYSFEKKLSVVELYLSSEISYQDLAIQEGIKNPQRIVDWVKRFRMGGPDALRPRKKGRKKAMGKPKTENKNPELDKGVADANAERVKELEEELYWVKLENAFLKEARRLRLEDEAKMRERLSSSAVSEENSD